MFQTIEEATESVYLEMYIWLPDTKGFDFLKLLTDKAKRGLRVRVVLDSYGSTGFSKEYVTMLKESGAEIFFFSRFWHRIHRKILVVDERVAFIGGVNFHEEARHWDDLAVKVKGKMVASIISSFAKVYSECGGKDPIILSRKKRVILNKTRTWLVEHFPINKKMRMKKIYVQNIGQAEKNLVLVTPYFAPKHWFIALLHQAVIRGVDVEVIVPKNTDNFMADRVARFFMYKLSLVGVKFYLEPQMNHAKVMIIDEKEGLVGSHNLDFLSFELNSEVGIFFKDIETIKKLCEIVSNWKKKSVLFEPALYHPKFIDYVLSPIISLFTKIF